jgi:hypothetical protein
MSGRDRGRGQAGLLAAGREAGAAGGDGRGEGRRASGWWGCPAIPWRRSSPSCIWCGRWCCAWRARRRDRCCAASARADFAYRKKLGRREYVRVTLRETPEGLLAEKFPREGAGLLTSLTQSHGFAELPEG